ISGLNLRIQMLRNNRGPNRNDIIVSGFQTAPEVNIELSGSFNSISSRGFMSFNAPGADEYKVYVDGQLIGTYNTTQTFIQANFFPNSRISVVAENDIFGIPSFAQRHRLVRGGCSGGGRCPWYED
ncbi:MAG: hypothetical protein MI750_13790, partial [Xanthomonadales bacterium]|nr:hypothetical protein [Xanthomonadales bacterium]